MKENVEAYCMDKLEEEEIKKLASQILRLFDDYALLPRDVTANDRNNLKNAKVQLIALLRGEI